MLFTPKLKLFFNKAREILITHEKFSASLFFVALILIFFFPVIFQGKTLNVSIFGGGVMSNGPYEYKGARPLKFNVKDPGAFIWVDEPLSVYIAKVIKNKKEIPLWNPNMGTGYPILGGIQEGILFPLNYIPFFFSSQLGWDIFFLIRIILAGFFTFLFCRIIGLNKLPSLFAGVAFMFNGYTMAFLNMAHFSSEILIPFMLLILENFLQKPTTRNFILCIIGTTLTILPGMPEATFFTILIGFIWFIFSLLFIHEEHRNKFFFIGMLALIGTITLFLSAIQILPFIELLQNSYHSHQNNIGLSSFSIKTLASLFLPYNFLTYNEWTQSLSYSGISVFILSLLSLFSIKYQSKKNRNVILFFGLFSFFGILKIFGNPIINWIGKVPMFNVLIFTKYSLPAILFSIAILAAFSLQIIQQSKIKAITSKLFTILGLIVVVTIYSLQSKSIDILLTIKQLNTFPQELTNKFINLDRNLSFSILIIIEILIFSFFILLILKAHSKKKFFAVLIVLFTIAELYIYTTPLERADRYETFKKPPFIKFIQKDNNTFRVYGQSSPTEYSLLFPNTSSAFDIQDARFLMALASKRYFSFLEEVVGVSKEEIKTIRFTGMYPLDFENKFLDLLNIKYFLIENKNQDSITKKILKQCLKTNDKNIALSQGNLNGQKLDGIFLHAPSKIEFVYNISSPENKQLSFEYGVSQSGIHGSNGVHFLVNYQCGEKTKTAIDDLVDPSNNNLYHSWQKATLNFSDCQTEEVRIVFDSQDNGDNTFDHFFVGNFSTNTKNETVVYNKEIKIIENKNYMPRTFIVHRAKELFESEKIFSELKKSTFDIRNEIIIEKDLPDNQLSGNGSPLSDNSKAEITKYADEKVKIDAQIENDGFLVLLDQYYPGWKAFVDGKETEIYPTNYTFRSVYLTKGTHKVEFVYDPISYKLGKYVSLITGIFLTLAFIFRKKITKKYPALHEPS